MCRTAAAPRPAAPETSSAQPAGASGSDKKRGRGGLLRAEGSGRSRTGNLSYAMSDEQEWSISSTDGTER